MPRPMTRRERLTRIVEGRPFDRPAVKLWGAEPDRPLVHPAYEPVHRKAIASSDLMVGCRPPFNLYLGAEAERFQTVRRVPGPSPEWTHEVLEIRAPGGTLRGVEAVGASPGVPGGTVEHLLKEPDDLRRLLALPYRPEPVSVEPYLEAVARLGDRGIVLFGLDHAMFGLQRHVGPANFALWSVERRDLLAEAISVFAGRIRALVAAVFDAGVRPVFGWVGPEVCVPPIASPEDFDDFVLRFDKPLVDLIHERGGRAWVHCHGRMNDVLERFIGMGADVLNPIEPPPLGDVALAAAFARAGDRMALEGNVEHPEIETASEARVRELVREAVRAGTGRRFILCPTAGYMENPHPTPRQIGNWLAFLDEGLLAAGAVPA